MGQARVSEEQLVSRALDKARAALAAKRLATATQLGAPKVRPKVVDQLCQEGFERVGTKVRVPLDQQLDQLLATGDRTPLGKLTKKLAGTTATEAKKKALELCRAGQAKLVLQSNGLVLAPTSEDTVQSQQLKPLVDELSRSLKWLKKAASSKPQAAVLVEELNMAKSQWDSFVPEAQLAAEAAKVTGAAEGNESAPDAAWQTVRGSLMALADEDTGLVSIPTLAKRLKGIHPQLELRALLLAAFREGKVELRPEGGLGRLLPEDAAECPRGAGGVPLSWARLLGEA